MQPVDFTTLSAVCDRLRDRWIPARAEQVYQRDLYTISIALRTFSQRSWLDICWHPQAARICLGTPPPRIPDTFTFSDQLRHQLNGFALIKIETIAAWERVVDLQFAKRPEEEAFWHLYVEIMGKYSNVVLTDANNQIVTVAHQVNTNQSSVRTVQTGQPYQLPPALVGNLPKLSESQASWQGRVSLIPGAIKRQLLQSYRGISPSVAVSMIEAANLDPERSTESLQDCDWESLFCCWQKWLQILERSQFQFGLTESGYTVLGWGITKPVEDLQSLLDRYYTDELNRQIFQQLHHQLKQKIGNLLKKLRIKADSFQERLQQSDRADSYRQQADLLMAHLQQWRSGMNSITLVDFETSEPVTISLNPDRNAVQNAQLLYKSHQKLKRARGAVEPLLQEVQTEINYLAQVETNLDRLEQYHAIEDLQILEEIKEELIQQKYLAENRKGLSSAFKAEACKSRQKASNSKDESKPYIYSTPSGYQVWIGRNNRQNDRLTFRMAGDYDLWFHTQEIPGSHVLLRLEPGAIPEQSDLEFTANLSAYYSQARQSEQVPVVYTQPKHVYKPKGAKPGMIVYKQESVIWGRPQIAKNYLKEEV